MRKHNLGFSLESILPGRLLRGNGGEIYDKGYYGRNNQLRPVFLFERESDVIDGQHRLMVAKQNKLPIFYIVNPLATLEEVRIQNTYTKSWKATDFIQSFATLGKSDYLWLWETMQNNRFSLSTVLIFMYSYRTGHQSPRIKHGEFSATAFEKDRAEKRIKKMESIRPYINVKGGYNRSFLTEMMRIIDEKAFDVFVENIEQSGKTYQQPNNSDEVQRFVQKLLK